MPGRGAGGSLSTLDAGARGYRAAGGCPRNKDSEPVRSRTSKKTCRAASDEVGSVKSLRFRADVWKTRAKPCVSQRLRGRRELRKKGSPQLLFSSSRHVFHEDAVNTHGLPHVFQTSSLKTQRFRLARQRPSGGLRAKYRTAAGALSHHKRSGAVASVLGS